MARQRGIDLTLECAAELRRLAGTLPQDGFILRDIAGRIEEALERWESPRAQTEQLGALLVQAQRETSGQPDDIAKYCVARGVRVLSLGEALAIDELRIAEEFEPEADSEEL